jgi:hypothetical protein
MTADCTEHTLTLRKLLSAAAPQTSKSVFSRRPSEAILASRNGPMHFPFANLMQASFASLALHISLFLHSQSGQLPISLSTREACICVMHWLSTLIVHQPAKMCFHVMLLHFEGGKGTLMKQNLVLITLRQIKACVKCEWYVQHKWNMASSAFQWAASNKTAITVISIFQGSITRFERNWIYFSDHLLTCIALKKATISHEIWHFKK